MQAWSLIDNQNTSFSVRKALSRLDSEPKIMGYKNVPIWRATIMKTGRCKWQMHWILGGWGETRILRPSKELLFGESFLFSIQSGIPTAQAITLTATLQLKVVKTTFVRNLPTRIPKRLWAMLIDKRRKTSRGNLQRSDIPRGNSTTAACLAWTVGEKIVLHLGQVRVLVNVQVLKVPVKCC